MFKISYSPIYQHPLPDGHRFPMEKYLFIPKQLIHEGVVDEQNFFESDEAKKEQILLTHSSKYVDDLFQLKLDASHMRRIGFPLSAELVQRELKIIQGTLDCARYALQFGASLNVAGGTHHAFADKGEGFCMLNDLAFAANVLLNEKLVKRILIIDLDVHQGNGTASIFKNNPEVFTFSMHGQDNYPFHKEKSDLDIALSNGTSDKEYMKILEYNLNFVFEKHEPDFIFYQCGVDILSTDKFGKLQVSEEGCKKRDEMVFKLCKQNKIPIAGAMGGGYSPRISDIVNAHCHTFKLASSIFF